MTKLAILESGSGENKLHISSFGFGEYISLQFIISFLLGTLCYAVFFSIWLFIKWDNLNDCFSQVGVHGFLLRFFGFYAIFMVLYQLLTWFTARKKYMECKKRASEYVELLDTLSSSYADENSEREN